MVFPPCINFMESREKEENVVNPPSSPIPNNKNRGLLDMLSDFNKKPANIPKHKQPRTLVVKVA